MKATTTILLICLSLVSLGQTIDFTTEEKKWIQDNPEVTYAYAPEWKPFLIVENGQLKGIAKDYLSLISEKTGIKFKGVLKDNWTGSWNAFKNEEVDLLPCLVENEERCQEGIFSDIYIQNPAVIVNRRDAPYIDNLNSLNGKTIAMAKDYNPTVYIQKNYPDINLVLVENANQAMIEVSTGRAEATIVSLPIAAYYSYYEGIQNIKVAAPAEGIEKVDLRMIMQPQDTILQSILNKCFENIYPKDKDAIFGKWISVKHDQTSEVSQVIWISVGIGIVALLFVIFLIVWTKKLKNEVTKRELAEQDLNVALASLTKKNEEKQTMLQEIHHRMKNNLQVINSLLRLQTLESEDEKTINMFKEAQNRVVTMALLHEKLYQSDDMKYIDVSNHFELLSEELIGSFSVSKKVKLECDLESVKLESKIVVSLGLIINEMITNSMKYAFVNSSNPKIFLGLKRIENSNLELIYTDNGIGVPLDVLDEDSDSLGMTLITTLSEQIEGDIAVVPSDGTKFRLVFPYKEIS